MVEQWYRITYRVDPGANVRNPETGAIDKAGYHTATVSYDTGRAFISGSGRGYGVEGYGFVSNPHPPSPSTVLAYAQPKGYTLTPITSSHPAPEIQTQPTWNVPQGVLTEVKGPSFFQKVRYSAQTSEGATRILAGVGLVGIGAVKGIADVFKGTADIVVHPIKTGKELWGFGKEAVKTKGGVIWDIGGRIGEKVKAEPEYSLGYAGGMVAGGWGIGKITDIAVAKVGQLPIGKYTPTKTEKVPSVWSPDILPYSRQRATMILEVKEGEKSLGFLLGKTKGGEYIALGGKPNVGESLKVAALRETTEEIGISKSFIKEFKYLGKYATPEETQNIFYGTISKETFGRAKAQSDIAKGLKLFKSEDFAGILGPTAKTPRYVKQGGFLGIGANKVRITEASILGNLEISPKGIIKGIGKETTKAFIETPKGRLNLFMQSRYNVPAERQADYFGLFKKAGKYKYSKEFFEGKQLTITGIKMPKMEMVKTSKRVGTRMAREPQLLVSGTMQPPKAGFLGLGKKFKVIGGKTKRGVISGIYFQPPVIPKGEGFIGLSYVLGGAEAEKVWTLFPKINKPNILYGKMPVSERLLKVGLGLKKEGYGYGKIADVLGKEAKPGEIIPTAKSIFGIETEVVAPPKTSFEYTKGRGFTIIEGKVVGLKPIKKLSRAKAGRVEQLYKEYESATGIKKAAVKMKIKKATGIKPSEFEYAPKKYVSIAPRLMTLSPLKNVFRERYPIGKTIRELYPMRKTKKEGYGVTISTTYGGYKTLMGSGGYGGGGYGYGGYKNILGGGGYGGGEGGGGTFARITKLPPLKWKHPKGKEIFGRIKLLPQPKKYQPSIVAETYKIKMPKAPRGILTGIEIRPLVARRRRK